MKNSIKILATVGIVFLLSFTTQAQTDHWSGQWNTKYGTVTISKNGDGYTGTFRYGKLTEGREQDGMLIGRYTRNSRTPLNRSLGNKGEFRFILSADKTKFDGYHKSETDTKWGSENWYGEKVWGTVMPVIVSNNIATVITPTWTGTWETNTLGRFKVLETDIKVKNTNNNLIKGRFFIKGSGDFMDVFDVEGYSYTSRPKVFEGSFKHGERHGYFKLTFNSPTFDTFTGTLTYPEIPKKNPLEIRVEDRAKTVWVNGTRTSSGKPNMNNY